MSLSQELFDLDGVDGNEGKGQFSAVSVIYHFFVEKIITRVMTRRCNQCLRFPLTHFS